MTSSPGAFLTGVDSPVRRDSSTIPIPSSTSASIGTTSFFSSKIRSPLRSAVDSVVRILLTSPSVTIVLLWTSEAAGCVLRLGLSQCISQNAEPDGGQKYQGDFEIVDSHARICNWIERGRVDRHRRDYEECQFDDEHDRIRNQRCGIKSDQRIEKRLG